jgi:hypothetical protein
MSYTGINHIFIPQLQNRIMRWRHVRIEHGLSNESFLTNRTNVHFVLFNFTVVRLHVLLQPVRFETRVCAQRALKRFISRMYLEMWREQGLLLERLFTVGTLVGSHVAVSFYVLHQMTLLYESFTAVGAQKRFLSWKNKSIQPNASLGATWARTVDKIVSGKSCTLQVDRCGVSCGFPEPRIAQSLCHKRCKCRVFHQCGSSRGPVVAP